MKMLLAFSLAMILFVISECEARQGVPQTCKSHISWAYKYGKSHGQAKQWYQDMFKVADVTYQKASYEDFQRLFKCANIWKKDCNDKGLQFPKTCSRLPCNTCVAKQGTKIKTMPKKKCVRTEGGNSEGACCHFPFTNQGVVYRKCSTNNNNDKPWCYTTPDNAKDVEWGNCIIAKQCALRESSQPCYEIANRKSCLTSTDSRRDFQGQACVWCPNGACTSANENRCEPKTWLKDQGVSDFEECLEVESGSRSETVPKKMMNAFEKMGEGRCASWNHANWIKHKLSESSTDPGIKGKTEQWCRDTCDGMEECSFFSYTPGYKKWCYLWKGPTCAPQKYHEYITYKKQKPTNMCTGQFQEDGSKAGNGMRRPPPGTKCVGGCIERSDRWGKNFCRTADGNWGAECVPCSGDPKGSEGGESGTSLSDLSSKELMRCDQAILKHRNMCDDESIKTACFSTCKD